MAEGQNQPNRVEQTAKQTGGRAIGKAVSSRIVNSAAGKAVGSALGAIGGTVLPVVGNVIGGIIGGAAAGAITKGIKESGKALGALPFALANLGAQIASLVAVSLTQALGTAFTFTVALAAGLAVFAAFALFVINSGAYIVPPGGILGGPGEPGGPGDEIPTSEVGCYQFTSSWDAVPTYRENITNAARQIMTKTEAREEICGAGPILVSYRVGSAYGGRVTSANSMEILTLGAQTQRAAFYTLAHETGHIVYYRNGSIVIPAYGNSGAITEGFLPSYGWFDCSVPPDGIPEQCLTQTIFEDTAEALGLWLMWPTTHSRVPNYPTSYPLHYQFAQTVFSSL